MFLRLPGQYFTSTAADDDDVDSGHYNGNNDSSSSSSVGTYVMVGFGVPIGLIVVVYVYRQLSFMFRCGDVDPPVPGKYQMWDDACAEHKHLHTNTCTQAKP